MSSPASKRRRANRGHAVPVYAAKSTPRPLTQGLSFSTEILCKIASFLNTKNNDLFNMCVAVGPVDAPVIRRVWLTGNSRYLWRITKKNLLDPMNFAAARQELTEWMELNPDWRNRCTRELAHSSRWSAPRVYQDGREKIRANPAVLFNNPAAAIELGMVDILRHLVEVVGIDINDYEWSGYTRTNSGKNLHLLTLAAKQKDRACFDYLMTRPSVNVGAGARKDHSRPLWLHMLLEESVECCEAMINHRTFDPHGQFWDTYYQNFYLPIQSACMACTGFPESYYAKRFFAKTKLLLEKGGDPERRIRMLGLHWLPPELLRQMVFRQDEAASGEGGRSRASNSSAFSS